MTAHCLSMFVAEYSMENTLSVEDAKAFGDFQKVLIKLTARESEQGFHNLRYGDFDRRDGSSLLRGAD